MDLSAQCQAVHCPRSCRLFKLNVNSFSSTKIGMAFLARCSWDENQTSLPQWSQQANLARRPGHIPSSCARMCMMSDDDFIIITIVVIIVVIVVIAVFIASLVSIAFIFLISDMVPT